MTTIDDLLKADEENSKLSRRVLYDFDPWFPEAFDAVANLFTCFMRAFSQDANDDGDLRSDGERDQVLGSLLARRARPLLLLQAYRAFMYAASDFRRLKVAAAIGFLRVEIEAVALMNLMNSRQELAAEWFNIQTDQEGVNFYRKTSKDIKRFRELLNLKGEWDFASAASQHVRLIGMADGLTSRDYKSGDRYVYNFSLSLQDFKRDHPEEYILRGLYILRTQGKLLIPMSTALPEAADPLLLEQRIPKFRKGLKRLSDKFGNIYRGFISQFLD